MRMHRTRRMAAAMVLASVATLAMPSVAMAEDRQTVTVREGESIQAAIDAAEPGTTIVVRGDHTEQVWIDKSDIDLVGRDATITLPEHPVLNPCSGFDGNGQNPEIAALICVAPVIEGQNFPAPADYLRNVSVVGFDLVNPAFDAVAALFTTGVEIARNTMVDPGCDGVFVFFGSDFEVTRNTISGSQNCAGVGVVASSNGAISRNISNDNAFNGISVNDSSDLVIDRNRVSGNCIGLAVTDDPDPGEFPSTNVTITRNQANANNAICFPFGPDIPVGATGILVAGVDGVTVERNTANNNVTSEFSVTAGGLFISDFPDDVGGIFSVTTDARVLRNTAFGNSSAAGPADLFVPTVGESVEVRGNRCQYGVPDASWCRH